jgi:hypothetical protein
MSIKKNFTMQINQPRLAKTIAYYDSLLRRYARRFVHNDGIAAGIVLQVIDRQYELNGLVAGKHLRTALKADVLLCCLLLMQAHLVGNQEYLINSQRPGNITNQTETGKAALLN